MITDYGEHYHKRCTDTVDYSKLAGRNKQREIKKQKELEAHKAQIEQDKKDKKN